MKVKDIIINEGFWDSLATGLGANASADAIKAYNKTTGGTETPPAVFRRRARTAPVAAQPPVAAAPTPTPPAQTTASAAPPISTANPSQRRNTEAAREAGYPSVAAHYNDMNTRAMSDDPAIAAQAKKELAQYTTNKEADRKDMAQPGARALDPAAQAQASAVPTEPSPFKYGDPLVLTKGAKPLMPNDPNYKSIANSILNPRAPAKPAAPAVKPKYKPGPDGKMMQVASKTSQPNGVILTEGGNVFADVSPIKKQFVPGIIAKIQAILPKGIEMIPHIGSAGFKVESGDMDVFVDAAEIAQAVGAKDEKTAKVALKNFIEKKGYQCALSGRNVHVRMPVPDGSFVQVDVMVIPDAAKVAPFHTHGPSGQYNDPAFKGGQLFVMYSSLAKPLGLKFSPFEGKLTDRTTGELVANDKDAVAKILLNPTATAEDLASIKSIMRALENDPRKDEKLAQAREDAKKGIISIPESTQVGSPTWFRRLSSRI